MADTVLVNDTVLGEEVVFAATPVFYLCA